MFWSNKDLTELEKEKTALKKQVAGLKEQVAELKLKKKIEDEDIKHMIKMRNEKLDLEFQKKELLSEGSKNDAIADVKAKYRDKLEERLHKEVDSIKEMYGQILERLPNVNLKMKG